MNDTTFGIRLRVAAIATGSFLLLASANGQESWNSGREGGQSRWGAGTTVKRMPEPQMNTSGSASWVPGKQNFTPTNQRSGVWRDTSASAETSNTSGAKGILAGGGASGGSIAASRFHPMRMRSAPTGGQARLQQPQRSSSLHPSLGPHFGTPHGGPDISRFRSARRSSSGFGSWGSSGGNGKGFSLGATKGNSTGLPTQPSPSLLREFPDPHDLSNADALAH